jgi:hypothetical protein
MHLRCKRRTALSRVRRRRRTAREMRRTESLFFAKGEERSGDARRSLASARRSKCKAFSRTRFINVEKVFDLYGMYPKNHTSIRLTNSSV